MNIAGTYSMPSANTIFSRMDKDGDGGITAEEFGGRSVGTTGGRMVNNKANTFNEIDADGDGVISQNEFKQFHSKLEAKMREITSGATLANYLTGNDSNSNSQLSSLSGTSVEDLLAAMKAQSEGKDGTLTGIASELAEMIEKLKSSVNPGDMLNVDA